MSVRHIALAVFGVLVVGMGVYLFLEVRSSLAVPQARWTPPPREAEPAPSAPSDKEGSKPYRPVASGTDGARSAGGNLRGMARKLKNEAAGGDQRTSPPTAPAQVPVEGKLEGPKLDAVMAEANKAYDKMDFDEARSIAQKVLKQQPSNTRMLRIMTSAYCIETDAPEAQKYFNLLPPADREQMKTRCARYGVTFTDPPK